MIRYRIRRKLDAIKIAARESDSGKRGKKSSKGKDQEKIIKKVEESIEKILNIDDIEYTPFMEYFRRASSYVFFGLLPTAKKSICLLPLPVTFKFCDEDENEDKSKTIVVNETTKSTKKLRTKKEKRAKQFIRSRSTNLDAIQEKVEAAVKSPVKPSTEPVDKVRSVKKPSRTPARPSPGRRVTNEQVKHFDEEEQPVKKLVGVESKKRKNKKRFQIIGQEVKIKPKHTNTPPLPTTTATIPSTPVTTTAPPVVQRPTPSPKPDIRTTTTTTTTASTTTTTTHAPLRSISEMIQEEAATLLSTQASTTEETKEEISEVNRNIRATTIAPSVDLSDDSTSAEDNDDSTTSDNETSDSDSDDDEEEADDDDDDESSEENDDDTDSSTIKKTTKGFYENAKESVHGVFDLDDGKDSS